jgi:hypothetical protein
LDIGEVAVAGFQIGFVGVERLRDGDLLGCPATIRARERAHLLLSLPNPRPSPRAAPDDLIVA